MSQPRLVEKETGEIFILVRDDVAENGKLYVAPYKDMTSMRSIRPEAFKERFEWYVEPQDRPVPVSETTTVEQSSVPLTAETVEKKLKPRGGRPKGAKDKKPRRRRST